MLLVKKEPVLPEASLVENVAHGSRSVIVVSEKGVVEKGLSHKD